MKRLAFLLCAALLIPQVSALHAEETASIGAQAGRTARQVQEDAVSTYMAAREETHKKAQEIQKLSEEALETYRSKSEQAWEDIVAKLKPFLENARKEWESFLAEYQKPKQP